MGATASNLLRRCFIKLAVYLYSFCAGATVKDKVLHSNFPSFPPDLTPFGDKSVVEVLFDVVKEELEKHGDRVCLQNGKKIVTQRSNVFGRESCNLSDIIPMSTKVAKALYHKYGIRRNDVVYLVLPNSCDYFWPVLGAWLCQAVVSPTDPTLTTKKLIEQMEDIKPRVIFCCKSTKDRVKAAVAETGLPCTIITMDGGLGNDSFDNLIEGVDELPNIPREACNHDDTSIILWSSGTTGRPKGIRYTHAKHLGWWCAREVSPVARKLSPLLKWIIGDVLMTNHFHHLSGFRLSLTYGILNGTVTFVSPDDIDGPETLFPIISLVRPTTLILPSHHCIQLARKRYSHFDLSSVSTVISIGSCTYEGIEKDFVKNFPSVLVIANVYSLSEAHVVSVSPDNSSIGSIVPNTLVKIEDPETGELLGPGTVGEIMVKPPSVVRMDGYVNCPKENAMVFTEDGWVHTGDLGHYDENGLLYFASRLKDLIKYQGCPMYPIDIEQVIIRFPGVIEAAVFGRPDVDLEELVSAFVIIEEGVDITENEIMEYVDSQVPDFQRLRGGVKFIEELPRNANGKVLRKRLLDIWESL